MDFYLAWENSRHLATLPLAISPPNEVWETSTENPYWSRVTTQIWVELLIGWIKFSTRHDQSEALPRSAQWRVISMEFLRSFLRHHLAGKPVVASPNVSCFLKLTFTFLLSMYNHLKDIFFREAQTTNFKTFQLGSCIDYVYKLVKDLITRHRKCNL